MNNIIKRKWNQNSMVIIEDLQGMAFQAESGGHTFQISGIDGEGNAVALSGTPAGVMLRADGQDVTLTCSASEGVISATLPANAYSVPGRFGLTIFLTSDGQKTAIYAAVGTVGKTSSGTVAPPAGSDVVDLVNAIATAVATIPASYTDLMASVAPTYSSSGLYAVGSYAWYNGKLYRCTTAITSGETWTSGHWTLANLGSDLVDLKSKTSAADDSLEELNIDVTGSYKDRIFDLVTGAVNRTNGNINYQVADTFKVTPYLPIPATTIRIDHNFTKYDPAYVGWAIYDENKTYIRGGGTSPIQSVNTATEKYIVLSDYSENPDRSGLFVQYITDGSRTIKTDIADNFNLIQVNEEISGNYTVPVTVFEKGFVDGNNGNIVTTVAHFACTPFIKIPKSTGKITNNFNWNGAGFAFYDENKTYIIGNTATMPGFVPFNAVYVRFSDYDTTDAHSGKTITFISDSSDILDRVNEGLYYVESELMNNGICKLALNRFCIGEVNKTTGEISTSIKTGVVVRTNYIPIPDGVTKISHNCNLPDSNNVGWGLYNASYEPIKAGTESTIAIPTTAKYLMLSDVDNSKAHSGLYIKYYGEVKDQIAPIYTKNLFNPNDIQCIDDYYVQTNGEISRNIYTIGVYFVSGFIEVNENSYYSISPNMIQNVCCAFYDEDYSFLSYFQYNLSQRSYNIPSPAGAKYARFTGLIENKDSTMFEESQAITQFVPYYNYAPIYDLQNQIDILNTKVGGAPTRSQFATAATMENGDSLSLQVPDVKQNNRIAFYADIPSEGGSVTELNISHGVAAPFSSGFIIIDPTYIKAYGRNTTGSVETDSYEHGLTFTEYISVIVHVKDHLNATVTIVTGNAAKYTCNITWNGNYGTATAKLTTGSLTNCGLTFYCDDYAKDVWAFGDSYFDMWPQIANTDGANNWLLDGHSGRGSVGAYTSLSKDLDHGLPKYILWCMGMNDGDSESAINANWKSTVDTLITFCANNGVKLILSTIPNTPNANHTFKNAYVKASGQRYVDICEAVGADEDIHWYTGLLSADNTHPTDKGKLVIAMRMMSDVPEMFK